jgi:hypothetical protein
LGRSSYWRRIAVFDSTICAAKAGGFEWELILTRAPGRPDIPVERSTAGQSGGRSVAIFWLLAGIDIELEREMPSFCL